MESFVRYWSNIIKHYVIQGLGIYDRKHHPTPDPSPPPHPFPFPFSSGSGGFIEFF